MGEYDDRYEPVYEDVEPDLPPVKGEARQKRLDNRTKMVVTNRSAIMLNRLVREQKTRRRTSRRKRGAA